MAEVGGGLVLGVIAALVLIASGAASTIARAAEVVLIVCVVIGGVAWLVHQARRERPGQAISGPLVQLPASVQPRLDGAGRRQVESGCRHSHHRHRDRLPGF